MLWEFWNYWAGAKWHYSVPIMENLKIFEMPVPGHLGFPAFARMFHDVCARSRHRSLVPSHRLRRLSIIP